MGRCIHYLLLASLILAWPVTAQANIGESLSQLRARYGSAKKLGEQMLFHVKVADHQVVGLSPSADPHAGCTVTVYFDGDHSAMEIFTSNSDDPGKSDLSQDDIKQILESEGDGMDWNQIQSSSGKPTWMRRDKKLIARFSPNESGKEDDASVLVIMLNAK